MVCDGAVATGAAAVGGETAGAEAIGAEAVGAAAMVVAAGGAGCLRAKNKIAATRIDAATETIISAVEFDLEACFGLDDAGVILEEGSAAGMVTTGGTGDCGSSGAAEAFTGGALLGGTSSVGTMLGKTGLGGTTAAGTLTGETELGATAFGRTGLIFAPAASGTLGRGT